MSLTPMPGRILALTAILGSLGGGIFGFIRGLSYLPTLPFAVIEGAILIGVPATVLGLVLMALWSAGNAVRR